MPVHDIHIVINILPTKVQPGYPRKTTKAKKNYLTLISGRD